MSTTNGTDGSGYLGYTGGWAPVVALIDALESDAPDATRDLLREAHRAGLVTSFDWPTWMTGRGRELAGHPEAIAEANLEECRRLLVAHLRRDRFVADHLHDVIASGEICAILRRAQAITVARGSAPAPAKLPLTGAAATPTAAPAATPTAVATPTPPPASTVPAARAMRPEDASDVRRSASTPPA